MKEGMQKGIEKGIKEGESRKLIHIVCRMLQRDITPEEIADNLEENIDYVKEIYDAAEKYAYDCDKIYAKLADR